MLRSLETEFLDQNDVEASVRERSHREMLMTHRLLGDLTVISRALRRGPWPVHRVLDIGCGDGGVLRELQRRLHFEGIGVDLKPTGSTGIPILEMDAAHEPLPSADVALCLYTAHHLSEEDLIALIRNVSKSCPRLLLLDVVRHSLPLFLFRMVAPLFVSKVNVDDGRISIRRAYSPTEFRAVIARALESSGATFRCTVAPFFIRQVADITFRA